ncbi:FGGY-family carbohydrate kinase [Caproiciproducens sp. R2]|uniref:FGGY-family carbohydrate kinase n=1 Tax=Caproiciproducens sp. R2 TaxID=3435187 RepID=UPI0040339064
MLLMGIDIGTTNCKLHIYDQNGDYVDGAKFSMVSNAEDYDSDFVWNNLKNCIKKLATNRNQGQQIAGIGISSQGESGLLIDKNRVPLTRVIPWYHTGSQEIVEKDKEKLDSTEIYHITGLDPHYIFSLQKIRWLKKHHFSEYQNAFKWHCLNDYIGLMLTGQDRMEYSSASRTMALDIAGRRWSDRIFELTGIKKSLMPDLIESGSVLGKITSSVARELNINSEAVVTLAGFDHMVGCFGVGASCPGTVVASMGTTESVCMIEGSVELGQSFNGYLWGDNVIKDKFYKIGGIPCGGRTIDWAIENILNADVCEDTYRLYSKKCGESSTGSGGVVFLPHLNGCYTPEMNSDAKAMFTGITLNTSTADLLRAVIEGLCYEFRVVLEQGKKSGIDDILAIGGGTANHFWLQCKADVLNIPIRTVEVKEAVTFGAALLAGHAAGIYSENQNIQVKTEKTFYPDPEAHAVYEKIYQKVYKQLYATNIQITSELDKILKKGG